MEVSRGWRLWAWDQEIKGVDSDDTGARASLLSTEAPKIRPLTAPNVKQPPCIQLCRSNSAQESVRAVCIIQVE